MVKSWILSRIFQDTWLNPKTRIIDFNEKKQSSAQKVKDAQIATLKSEYKHGSLEVMDYLMAVSVFCKNYDELLWLVKIIII